MVRWQLQAEVERLRAVNDRIHSETIRKWADAEAVIERVRALHKPVPGSHSIGSPYRYCSCEGIAVPWPCRTIRALEGTDG
jgi:hypothetical protein